MFLNDFKDFFLLKSMLYQEVEAREEEDGRIKTEVDSIDGRLEKTEVL